jgi:hypothetical protein
MTDDEIYDFFLGAVESLSGADRDAAMQWLAKHQSALQVIHELETKGIAALLS